MNPKSTSKILSLKPISGIEIFLSISRYGDAKSPTFPIKSIFILAVAGNTHIVSNKTEKINFFIIVPHRKIFLYYTTKLS